MGRLTGVRGRAIAFTTPLWLSPSDRLRIQIRNPIEDAAVVARVLVRKTWHAPQTLTIQCVADAAEIAPADLRRLGGWIEQSASSARGQVGQDPMFAQSTDRRRVMVTWLSPGAFLRSWRQELSSGSIRLKRAPGPWERIVLLFQLPDGQRLPIPARVVWRRGAWHAEFRVHLPARQKLRVASRWCAGFCGVAISPR